MRRHPPPGGLKRSPSGDDFTGKREFIAPDNIVVGSAAAVVGAGAGVGASADAVAKPSAHWQDGELETDLK